MKLFWVCAVANAIGLSVAMGLLETETAPVSMNLLEAAALPCQSDSECPALTCHSTTCTTSGFCLYTPLELGTRCPGESCSNGGACDDDANDYCDLRGTCISGFKGSETVCRPADGECDAPEGNCVDRFLPSTSVCRASKGQCDANYHNMHGNGNCVDIFLPSTTVCKPSAVYALSTFCSGKSGFCPVTASLLEGNLREMMTDDQAPVQSMLMAVSPSSPMVLLGLVCVVAAAVAMVTMRQRRDDLALEDATYKLLATHEDASIAL
ncbi:hypothetical protein SPRG_01292 [Saprolegnia parasitica CBS 223.65]|uniref:Disintegrin domain-containing protein n=1 Tax=Saprolegnia parasitica (strain CBS 223.65) TaxID=695850 RepID=A0A067CU17_SAPPC|nr:hypothetical protein SPRG_01292 [Saprolegnia parasitica CBS 223.65]KDO34018.1 hypothetical protein SPRG_01292 [Saprolegnia parasitica CBS 223.65]|eukprot:XP_012194903.1 hypothetical protein SPRG_01292 [Saprolegnia parasitica CBS 223.65]